MAEPFTQRRLSIELRYGIDLTRLSQRRGWRYVGLRDGVIKLIEAHPQGMKSRHVLHNLGKERLEWLRKEGIFDGSSEPRTNA
jgi:hypothetical protein